MTKERYQFTFSLAGQDYIDFLTCRAKFKVIEIVRLGIREALKSCLKPSPEIIKKAKDLV